MELTEDQKKEYIASLESYQKGLKEGAAYSIQRIDLLIISVSGAGIYTSFELMKYVATSVYLKCSHIENINVYFKITALFFTISIIINFISQITAYKSKSLKIDASEQEIHDLKNGNPISGKVAELECLGKLYNKGTIISNRASTIIMLSGLICLIVFIWNLF